jgi:hypothetical protein
MDERLMEDQVNDALHQVRRMREVVLDKRIFRGYSGVARMLSGTVALAGTCVLSARWVPANAEVHLAGWGAILAIALVANYAALVYWFAFHPDARRQPRLLKPAVDAVPALVIGAVLSAALIVRGQYGLLFGTWLCLYGLAQVAYRQSLPPGIYRVGLCYLISGAYFLLSPRISFLRPWPVGALFFAGEWIGGIILWRANHAEATGRS